MLAICGLVAVAAIAIVGGGSYLGRMVGSSFGSDDEAGGQGTVIPGQEVTIEIPSGSSAEDIGAILAAQGVVRSALEFEVAVRNNEADLYFECHDVADYDQSTRTIINDTFLAGTLRHVGGKWVFYDMSAGPATPLSLDQYYA